MSRGRLKPEDEKCIQHNYLYLKQNLKALDIVDYLYQHEVITLEDKEHIKVGLTRTEQNEILLITLLGAGPGEAFNFFLKSLEPQYQSVLDHLNRTAQEQKSLMLLQEELRDLKNVHVTDEKDLKSLQVEKESLKKELEIYKTDLEELQQDFKSLQVKEEETVTSLKEEKIKNSEAQEIIESLKEERKFHLDNAVHDQENIESLKEEIKLNQDEKAKDQEIIATLKEEIKSDQDKNAKDQEIIESLKGEIKLHQEKLAKDEEIIEFLKEQNKLHLNKIAKDQEIIESLKKENQLHPDKAEKYKAHKEVLQKERNSLKIKLDRCTCEINKLQLNVENNDCDTCNTVDTKDEFQIFIDEGYKTVSGTHESEILKLGEDEAHTLFMNFKKNTHHEQFFPVEPFSLNDLPVGCREYHWLQLIKALAALTVRVDVKMTSMARPEFIPGNHCPYPYCNIRGSKTLRTGSGYLTEIIPIKRTSEIFCTCKKNKKFNKCKKKFWVLKVKTSKQVVFDEMEANHTSILFSFDPPVCGNSTVRLDTCTGIYGDTLSFVSCANICKQLAKLFADYVAVDCAHFDHSTSKFDINDCPVFIVSHPHGGSKKITIGERHSVVKVDKGYHKLLYTTSTCPGSSGAPVYDMADHDIKTHGGSMENGLSYSENYY